MRTIFTAVVVLCLTGCSGVKKLTGSDYEPESEGYVRQVACCKDLSTGDYPPSVPQSHRDYCESIGDIFQSGGVTYYRIRAMRVCDGTVDNNTSTLIGGEYYQ